ncbi:MAG: hypothetical protein L0H29_07705 [Sinobacteraceae bacterium]|nr:hypothetical protein [Nevskiaceae bacterium]
MKMSELIRYVGWFILALLALTGAAILSYWAPWYFAWVVGTAMIILITAFAGVLYDRQAAEHGEEQDNPNPNGTGR